MEPVSRMLSSSAALPGPIRAPDSKTMLSLTFGMKATYRRTPRVASVPRMLDRALA
jgi:hypothetical protein